MKQLTVCIRSTGTLEEAEMIVTWLEEAGIETTIIGRDNPGVFAFGITDTEGIAICVSDEETAERAIALLDQHEQENRDSAGTDTGSVDARCEECSAVTSFAAGLRGTVQQCLGCGGYLDVPINSE